jgi:hypothetical protein
MNIRFCAIPEAEETIYSVVSRLLCIQKAELPTNELVVVDKACGAGADFHGRSFFAS